MIDFKLMDGSAIDDIYQLPAEMRQASFKKAAATSGCFALVVTDEQLKLMSATSPVMEKVLKPFSGGSYIYMYEEFVHGLTEAEKMAVLGHEIGHLHYQHMINADPAKISENGVLMDIPSEIEADLYSVQVLGNRPTDLMTGIVKVVQNAGRFLFMYRQTFTDKKVTKEKLKALPGKLLEGLHGDEALKQRFEILRTLV